MHNKFINKQQTAIFFWSISILILLVVIAYEKLIAKNHSIFIYITLCLLAGICLYKLLSLRYFSIEITHHFISINYMRPFYRGMKYPALEIPIDQIISYKIEKITITYYLHLTIKTKTTPKKFSYKIGYLNSKQKQLLLTRLDKIDMSFNQL